MSGCCCSFPSLWLLCTRSAQNYLQAASLLERVSDPHASGWIANYDVHPVDVHDTTFDFRGKAIAARVYLPRGVAFAPGIVVVHGMHELGIDEPRLVSFARSLAASGFFVMTPLVPGIADYRIQAESADAIGSAARAFAQQLEVPKVGIFAISFSGGLALLAASDPQYARTLPGWRRLVAITTWRTCSDFSLPVMLFGQTAPWNIYNRTSMVL